MELKFNEFMESDESLKHELGSIQRSCLSPVLADTVVAYWSLKLDVCRLETF